MKRLCFAALIAALAGLAACAKVKEPAAPSARVVAERITVRKESPQRLQRWLLSRGFQQIQRTGYGGVWPRTGPCFQTVKGILYRDRTVTRVCFAADRYPVVLERDRVGYYWTEVYPQDLSHNLYGPSGLGAISDETVRILEQ